jgi:hypothetical protein
MSLLESLPGIDEASSSLRAARAFGVLAALTGGVAMMWMLISITFTGTNKSSWISIASLLVGSTALQLITFVAYSDDMCQGKPNLSYVKCSIVDGSAFAISASIPYLLSSIGVFFVAPPEVPLVGFDEDWRGRRAQEERENETIQTPMADTAVRVHPNAEHINVSSTSPPHERLASNINLLHAGATVFHPVPEQQPERPTASSTVPPRPSQSFPGKENLVQACASVSQDAVDDERSGTLSSVDSDVKQVVEV